ncbi:hypothetical protein NC652_023375 [Populus alba x Populus x berolinensis]|nr:hypothetical protein NC652_022391 [Populus alba x Populus x berolinensis]KAJ6905586.1 hypothetical protein NC652_023375 [Populus alba x Populus x berolinensis]
MVAGQHSPIRYLFLLGFDRSFRFVYFFSLPSSENEECNHFRTKHTEHVINETSLDEDKVVK